MCYNNDANRRTFQDQLARRSLSLFSPLKSDTISQSQESLEIQK